MAFVTTELSARRLAGFTPPLVLVEGTYLNSGGGTGGIISPGFNNASGTLTAVANGTGPGGASLAAGARKIVATSILPTLADANVPGSARSYNTTRDREEETIVTVADVGGRYMMLCEDNGS